MKKILIVLVLIFVAFNLEAQSALDDVLREMERESQARSYSSQRDAMILINIIATVIGVFVLRLIGGWMFRITDLIKVQKENFVVQQKILNELERLNGHNLLERQEEWKKENPTK